MTVYKCWIPELKDEADCKTTYSFDEQHAAMDYVKFHHSFEDEAQASKGYVVHVKDIKGRVIYIES